MPDQTCPHCGSSFWLTPEQVQQHLGEVITCMTCHRPSALGNAAAARPPVLDYGRHKQPMLRMRFVLVPLLCGAILLLISMMLPKRGRATETANRIKCASNMRQIGQAIMLYRNENQGQYPPDPEALLLTQQISSEVFTCPSSDDERAPGSTAQAQAANLSTPGHLSYVYLGKSMNVTTSAEAVVLYEPLTNHKKDGANFLFAGGHITFIPMPLAQKIISEINAGQNPPPSARPIATGAPQ